MTTASEIEVIGEAKDGKEALRQVTENTPDVLLLDVEMPGMNGIEVAQIMKNREKYPTRILVLSAYDDQEYIREMMNNGASGYLLKDEAPERIIEALKSVAKGETGWLSPQFKSRLAVKKRVDRG